MKGSQVFVWQNVVTCFFEDPHLEPNNVWGKNAKSCPGLKKHHGVTYQEEQQRWAGAGSWGRAGEPPLIAGTGEWSDSCHSRRAWERGSWNRPERCIEQTLSPVQSDPENHSLCTGIAPPDGGPPGSAPPTTQAGWKETCILVIYW